MLMKISTLRRTSGLFLALLLVAATYISILAPAHQASALAGADFKAGRIIDNNVFYNSSSMSVSGIQNFLNTQVPTCDTNGTGSINGTTRASYGTSRGYPPPYTCLKDFYQNPSNGQSNYGGNPIPSGAKSAAQIIYDAAQTYNISPKVILVSLQKESAIVTDDWPWPSQYQTAMGYACPDTAPCDSQYYGFSNQVINAAGQFRRYATQPNSFNFIPGTNNTVQWNPNAGCGSGNVYIENQATASLYNYTPYQPNQAALDNLYGTGDSCSAYGNRNFWRMYNVWFGSTLESSTARHIEDSQARIQPISYEGQIYIFYFDAFRRVLRMATQDLDSGEWEYSILDGDKSAGGGRVDASLGGEVAATVLGNSLQLFYYDKTRGNLRHAWLSGGQWRFENLDGDKGSVGGKDSNLGQNASVTVFQDRLQLFYYDQGNGNLRHAWTSSNGWRFENLDGDGASIAGRDGRIGQFSTVTALGNSLQLYYNDESRGRLRHAWTTSQGWRFEDLDGGPAAISRKDGNVGVAPAATVLGKSLQLYYYDVGRGVLRHAWTTPNGWRFEDLDGTPGSIARKDADLGMGPSLSVFNNQLHIHYYDGTNGNLRHAWTTPSGWRFQNLDGDPGSIAGRNGTIGANPGSTVYGNSLQLYYYDKTRGKLRHAWLYNGTWNFEDLGPAVIY